MLFWVFTESSGKNAFYGIAIFPFSAFLLDLQKQ